MKNEFNKGIAAPIIVFLVLVVCSVLVASIAFWQYKQGREVSLEPPQLKAREAEEYMNKAESEVAKIKSFKDKREESLQRAGNAIRFAAEATKLNADSPDLWFRRGNIYFKLMDSVQNSKEWALKCYKKALELDPDNTLYHQKVQELQELN